MGDHKAIAFEQGAQCGGNFPCGTCGIHVSKFTDQTHALRRRVRSLQDIQNLATSGRFGKRLNIVRPFENLTMGEIQTKLHLRGCIDVDMPKAQLVAKLKSILEGVQRVKVVADQCTNRHPDNVTKVLLHVQSKQIENSLIGSERSLQNQDNRVSKESNFLPCYIRAL